MSASRLLPVFLFAIALPGAAHASSPEAWAALDNKVRAACQKASDLKDPVVAQLYLRYSDKLPIEARMVRGAYKKSGAITSLLCLYDRRTGYAETQEMPVQPRR